MATDPRRGPELPEDADLRAMASAYDFAEAAILAELRRVIETGRAGDATVRAESLRKIDGILERLKQSDEIARRAARRAAERSDAQTGRLVQAIIGTPDAEPAAAFSRVNERAVRELVRSMDDRLAESRRRVGREARDAYARAGRQATLQGLLGERGSRRKVSAEIVGRLSRQGITSFTDRAGRRWRLGHYAEMVARTTTREAVTVAAAGRMLSNGITVARVSTHGSVCPICGPLEGRLVGLTPDASAGGGDRIWQPDELPGLTGMPPFHPQCRHSIVPEVVGIQEVRTELALDAAA